MNRLVAADAGPVSDVALKSLYVAARSDIVLVDLDSPGYGEAGQDVMYAYLFGIPVVGISHRFILSPWVTVKLRAVIFPRTTDEIVQQVLAYDHKTTAMLDHYRAEVEAEKAVKKAEESVVNEPGVGPVHGGAVPSSV